MSDSDLLGLAANKRMPLLVVLMKYDNAVIIEGTVLSGMTEEQAMFVFTTAFSVFLIDWSNGSCRNLGVGRVMELLHR